MAARLVIEWTRSSARVALAEGRSSRARLRALHSLPIGHPEETAESLRTLLRTMRWTSGDVLVSIPREHVLTRVVQFPSAQRGELAQMVELYAKGQLPYPREQIVVDFSVVSSDAGFSTVAIVACQRDVVDRPLALLREARLHPTFVTVSSWAVLGWYRQAARSGDASEPSLIINVDDTRTDVVLIAGDRVLSSRSIGQGAQDWGSVSSIPELLAMEAERSRSAIRKELPGTEVRSLILTGVGPLAQWHEDISRRLGLSVAVREAPRPFWGGTETPASFSPIVVAGLAASEPSRLLDLSPPDLQGARSHRRKVRELVLVSVLLAAVLALGSSLLFLQVARHRQMTQGLDEALEHLAPQTKLLREKSRSVELVKDVLAGRRELAVVLTGVFRATPSSVTLEGIAFERPRNTVELKGSAASTQMVLDYMNQLERLEGIARVDLKYSTQRSTPSGERTSFELVLHQGQVGG